jgi:hypothetical protein
MQHPKGMPLDKPSMQQICTRCAACLLMLLPACLWLLLLLPLPGGKFTAKPVAAFLDPFLRDTLATLVVWPNRCANAISTVLVRSQQITPTCNLHFAQLVVAGGS